MRRRVTGSFKQSLRRRKPNVIPPSGQIADFLRAARSPSIYDDNFWESQHSVEYTILGRPVTYVLSRNEALWRWDDTEQQERMWGGPEHMDALWGHGIHDRSCRKMP